MVRAEEFLAKSAEEFMGLLKLCNESKNIKNSYSIRYSFCGAGGLYRNKIFSNQAGASWYDGIGDAQTILSSKHWVNDGFLQQVLAIPIGYSKIVRYLDDPQMRHAHGTVTGGLIGQRLYYTIISGYSLPYAML